MWSKLKQKDMLDIQHNIISTIAIIIENIEIKLNIHC